MESKSSRAVETQIHPIQSRLRSRAASTELHQGPLGHGRKRQGAVGAGRWVVQGGEGWGQVGVVGAGAGSGGWRVCS